MILHPHDPDWAREFQRLKAVYEDTLGALLLRAEHVGSTSILGIVAKPVLDIDLVIASESSFPVVKQALEGIGYHHIGDLGITDREVFKRYDERSPLTGDGQHWMTHHLYVCVEGSRELVRHTRFRDYLNAHPSARSEYESIKRDIEARSGGELTRYVDIKEYEGICSAFVERILKLAGAPEQCLS